MFAYNSELVANLTSGQPAIESDLKSYLVNNEFEILFISQNNDLFIEFFNYLDNNNCKNTLRLINDIQEIEPVELPLQKCEAILCDLQSNDLTLQLTAKLLEYCPAKTFIIGLTDGVDLSEKILNSPELLRFSGTVDISNGWEGPWAEIKKIWFAWRHPSMTSRIEDVSVDDVLQMVDSGRWTSTINIYGRSDTILSGNQKNKTKVKRGFMSFLKGKIKTAWSSDKEGVNALYDLLSIKEGHLQVMNSFIKPLGKKINGTIPEILMSYYVTLDENNAKSSDDYNTELIYDVDQNDAVTIHVETSNESPEKQNNQEPQITLFNSVDDWWRINKENLKILINNNATTQFPLRWMRERELLKLTRSAFNSRFLLFMCDSPSIIEILQMYGKEYNDKRVTGKTTPVMRLGQVTHNSLYFIFTALRKVSPIFSHYPCVLWAHSKNILPLVENAKFLNHSALIIVTPNVEEIIDLKTEIQEKVPGTCKFIPLNPDKSKSQILLEIFQTLSGISSGKGK